MRFQCIYPRVKLVLQEETGHIFLLGHVPRGLRGEVNHPSRKESQY